MNNLFYAFAGLLFAAVIFLLEGAYTWWSTTRSDAAKRIERRLQQMSAGLAGDGGQASILKQRYLNESPGFERALKHVPRIDALRRLLEQSGTGWSVRKFFLYSGSAFMACLVVGLILNFPLLLILVLGTVVSTVPLLLLTRTRDKRFAKFEQQLPEAADLISRALRAGHAFPSTLQMVRDEMPEPISGEFRVTADEINYGVPLNDALGNLAKRMPLIDLRYFIIAVLIQRESGGNLAEILENIAYIIRERFKLLGRIRVLSAEGKLSAWILGLLPFVVAFLINLVNPEYMRVLWTDPAGVTVMTISLVMMAVGVFVMRKIIRIRV